MTSTTQHKVEEVLTRGVSDLIDPDERFRTKLQKKVAGEYTNDIVVKFGVDPTRPDIHLGHAVVFRKLRRLQDLGCKVIFLVGDFTARIGDPTGKSKVRPELEQREVEENMKTFLDQVDTILRTDKEVFSWIRNSDWFTGVTDIQLSPDKEVTLNITHNGKKITANINPNSFIGKAVVFEKTRMQIKDEQMRDKISVITLTNFLWVLKHVTYNQLIQRDMFQDRLDAGRELYMHEMMYPVLQAIDSQVLAQIYGSCDLEIGGTDQMFNMMMARDLMKISEHEQQSVMTIELLRGMDGSDKMSKSMDNYIAITDEPHDMYGKVMSIPDDAIIHYFELATYRPDEQIRQYKEDLESGSVNPKDIKMQLAREIVAMYHGQDAAERAESHFKQAFEEGGVPEEIPAVSVDAGVRLDTVLVGEGVVPSKAQFRRLIEQGAVTEMDTGEKLDDPYMTVEQSLTLRVGKKRFIKITIDE